MCCAHGPKKKKKKVQPFSPRAGVDLVLAPNSWQSPFLAIICSGSAPAPGGTGVPVLQVWKQAWQLEWPVTPGSSAGQSQDHTRTLKPKVPPSQQLFKGERGNRSSPQFPLLPQRKSE